MDFKKISLIEAYNTTTGDYSPCYSSDLNQHYIYKDGYAISEFPYLQTLTNLQMDGLTPINPNKPMFPKK